MINTIVVMGRLGKDPELRHTKNDKSYVIFGLATNDGWGDNKRTTWHQVKLWGKSAEAFCQHAVKGNAIGVVGSLLKDTYQKDGQDVEFVYINANSWSFGSNKNDSDSAVSDNPKTDDDVDF